MHYYYWQCKQLKRYNNTWDHLSYSLLRKMSLAHIFTVPAYTINISRWQNGSYVCVLFLCLTKFESLHRLLKKFEMCLNLLNSCDGHLMFGHGLVEGVDPDAVSYSVLTCFVRHVKTVIWLWKVCINDLFKNIIRSNSESTILPYHSMKSMGSSTQDTMEKLVYPPWKCSFSHDTLCLGVSCEKQHPLGSTATLQPWCLNSRHFPVWICRENTRKKQSKCNCLQNLYGMLCKNWSIVVNIILLLEETVLIIYINKMQQYACIYLLQNHSTCFGRPSHPSSGVHKTVTAASGISHSIWATTFLRRGLTSEEGCCSDTTTCTRGCSYSLMCSWWCVRWTPETCRVIPQ